MRRSREYWASPRRATDELSCARLLQLRAVEAWIPNESPASTAQVVESAEPILAVSVHSGAVDTDVQKIWVECYRRVIKD